MRKIFFLACLLLLSVVTFASESKKVAILEVVDKEKQLDYSQKLMLRSNMSKAVTKTPGFEAYDRTDIDAIMSEHEFQNTGMVSKDQIQKLGEMAGVSFILVTEGVKTGENKMFVTVKLLNVETAKVEIAENSVMGITPYEMQRGCESLARKLFENTPQVSRSKTAGANTPAAQEGKGVVIRVSNKEYTVNGQSLNRKAYENFLLNNCTPAYAQFKSGRKLVSGGWACASLGLIFIAGGATMMALKDVVNDASSYEYYSDDDEYYSKSSSSSAGGILNKTGLALVSVGAVSVGVSIPLLAVGYVKQKKSVNTYNNQCADKKIVAFNLTAGTNGIGLAMNF